MDHMNSEEEQAVTKLVQEYFDIFPMSVIIITIMVIFKHHIRRTDEIPTHNRS